MRSLGLPEKIIDPETEEVYTMGHKTRPIAQGKIISDFVENGSLSAVQYRKERSELKGIYVNGNKFPVDPVGKGLFVCAACSASLEDFYYVAEYEMVRYEFSVDFQDGVKKDHRQAVFDFCCGTCLAGHQNRRREEEEDYFLTNSPESFEASEIRKKTQEKKSSGGEKAGHGSQRLLVLQWVVSARRRFRRGVVRALCSTPSRRRGLLGGPRGLLVAWV